MVHGFRLSGCLLPAVALYQFTMVSRAMAPGLVYISLCVNRRWHIGDGRRLPSGIPRLGVLSHCSTCPASWVLCHKGIMFSFATIRQTKKTLQKTTKPFVRDSSLRRFRQEIRRKADIVRYIRYLRYIRSKKFFFNLAYLCDKLTRFLFFYVWQLYGVMYGVCTGSPLSSLMCFIVIISKIATSAGRFPAALPGLLRFVLQVLLSY